MGVQQATVRGASGVIGTQITRIAGADQVTGNSLYFTAVEDLGAGMKVTAVNQMRFGAVAGSYSAATGTYTTATDNQNSPTTGTGIGDLYVQFEGSFGAIKAGKFTFASNAGYNAFGVRAITALSPAAGAPGLTSSGDNVVQYVTPDINGFKVYLGIGLPGVKVGQDPAIGVKVTYDQGPLNLQFAHTSSVNGPGLATAGGGLATYDATGRATVDTIAANYDFGAAKLSAAYFRRAADAPILASVPEANGYSVGLAMPVGAATFKAGVMNQSKSDLLLDRTSFGVDYALSKRTTLIAEYARDKRAASNDLATNNYFVGVSHTF